MSISRRSDEALPLFPEGTVPIGRLWDSDTTSSGTRGQGARFP
jgi:hypothetical protein